MTVAQLDKGFVVANTYLHAAERKLQGLCAVCGAGRIVAVIPGRFNPDDQRACPACAGRGQVVKELILRLV